MTWGVIIVYSLLITVKFSSQARLEYQNHYQVHFLPPHWKSKWLQSLRYQLKCRENRMKERNWIILRFFKWRKEGLGNAHPSKRNFLQKIFLHSENFSKAQISENKKNWEMAFPQTKVTKPKLSTEMRERSITGKS